MTTDPMPRTGPATAKNRPHDSPRLFLREPGWRIAHKIGSTREFCYAMTPGEDYYHRLLDGELYVYHGDERLCLTCAERRGLLSREPKPLRESVILYDFGGSPDPSDYDVEFLDEP
jgi:hypothetical protein